MFAFAEREKEKKKTIVSLKINLMIIIIIIIIKPNCILPSWMEWKAHNAFSFKTQRERERERIINEICRFILEATSSSTRWGSRVEP